MNIVFFVHRYWPVVGGVERYVHELAKALVAQGHRVNVVAGATDATLPEQDAHEGISIHRFPMQRSPLRARWWLLRNLGLFVRADVIHVSNTHMLEFFWRMVGFLVSRRKVFLTRHGLSYTHPVPDWEKRRAKRSIGLAAGVVHDGEFIGKWLGLKPDLCPNQGLSPPADELPYVAEPPPTSAAYIGRIEPDSGIRIYIDAVKILARDMGRPFHLDVYGDGSLLPSLRERVKRTDLPVTFHGRVANAQDRIVEACFAFIDGRMAIQEAMARRRLVLAGYTDPLKRDYVAGEPFSPHIVPVSSGAELAERVAHYIDHPDKRHALIEQAHRHARSLTWSRTAEAYTSLWANHLTSRAPRPSRWEFFKTALILNHEASTAKTTWAR